MSKTIVAGIDFGTSNSSVAYLGGDDEVHFVPLEHGGITMPTTLFFEEGRDAALYGAQAVNAFMQGEPGRFMRSIKRILGSPTMDSGTLINGVNLKFDHIIGLFVKNLKNRLEAAVQGPVDSVVMGRPVHFRDGNEAEDKKAEQQLRDITRKAGFTGIEFQFEPIAAAFAHERHLDGESLACVVDIGGGTSDFTLIKIGKALRHKLDRSSDILANTGVRVGGNDFDKGLSIQSVMPALGRGTTYGVKNMAVPSYIYSALSEWSEINFSYGPRTLRTVKSVLHEAHDPVKYSRLLALLEQERAHELLQLVEQTKIDLTAQTSLTRALGCVKDTPVITVTRDEFNDCIAGQIKKIRKCIEECLSLAQVSPDRVERIILTGGSTEIPLVKHTVRALLPNAVFSESDKLTSVGMGLAYDGFRRFTAAA